MIKMRLGAGALANVRFAISPLVEAMRSVRVLADPGGHVLHLPWAMQARRRTGALDLAVLTALQPVDAYTPDFADPPPSGPLTEIDDELAAMVTTPRAQVRAEVLQAYQGRPLPPVLEPFLEDPSRALAELAALVRSYWECALAQHWPRMRGLLEGDILYRARRMADGGARQLFADIDPAVRWDEGELTIEKRVEVTLDLGGRGLLFVPSVFTWPRVGVLFAPPWQPTIIYPARGVGALWEPAMATPPEALAALLGRSRAAILIALDRPRSTTDLAGAVGLSAGGTSQHLSVLRNAGLVHGHRVGRVVLNVRSAAGHKFLSALRLPDADAKNWACASLPTEVTTNDELA
jgi:DNA-binding transcriptional ArsR family regulator